MHHKQTAKSRDRAAKARRKPGPRDSTDSTCYKRFKFMQQAKVLDDRAYKFDSRQGAKTQRTGVALQPGEAKQHTEER